MQRRRDAIANPSLCKALLLDYCGTCKREYGALAHAVEEGIPGELKRGPGNVPSDVWFARLIRQLRTNQVMPPDDAEWAVHRWAAALGITAPQAPLEQPGKRSSEETKPLIKLDRETPPPIPETGRPARAPVAQETAFNWRITVNLLVRAAGLIAPTLVGGLMFPPPEALRDAR